MKKEILKNLDRYPYFKILSIPKNKKYKLKKEFFSVAKKLGETRYQNLKKDKIVEIKPNLKKINLLKKKNTKIKSVLRYHQTNLGGSIHSDGPQLDKPPKHIIMACEHNSIAGGDTILVNTKKIYNYLYQNKKKYLKILESDFFFERRGFKYKNKNVFSKPIFEKKNKFIFRYLRDYIEKGYKIKKKNISKAKKDALNLLDKLLSSKKFYKKLKLSSGDLIILNNHILAHGRTTFKVSDTKTVNRKLYRIWLN
jgi:alpha-ketoglutarate-dependent taurine dioxygenase